MRFLKKTICLLPVLLLLTGCHNCPNDPTVKNITFFAMDTVMSLTTVGEDSDELLNLGKAEVQSLEDQLSRTKKGTQVYEINAANGTPVTVDNDIISILVKAQELTEITGGLFDITVAPASDLWGFTKDTFHIPSSEELEKIQPVVGMDHLHFTDDTVWLDIGTEIDLGGIAKGYALDKMANILKGPNVEGAAANLGGDVVVLGIGPTTSLWRVGIQDPDYRNQEENYIGVLFTTDSYVLTSGGYERYFVKSDRKFQHIIDPRTCMPAESPILSASVVIPVGEANGMYADAIATALVMMDISEAINFWRFSQPMFDMILIDVDNNVYITSGLEDSFQIKEIDKYNYQFIS